MSEESQVEKCAQCGKPIETPVVKNIMMRDRCRRTNKAIIKHIDITFCSDQCGAHYQMGCEG